MEADTNVTSFPHKKLRRIVDSTDTADHRDYTTLTVTYLIKVQNRMVVQKALQDLDGRQQTTNSKRQGEDIGEGGKECTGVTS